MKYICLPCSRPIFSGPLISHFIGWQFSIPCAPNLFKGFIGLLWILIDAEVTTTYLRARSGASVLNSKAIIVFRPYACRTVSRLMHRNCLCQFIYIEWLVNFLHFHFNWFWYIWGRIAHLRLMDCLRLIYRLINFRGGLYFWFLPWLKSSRRRLFR